MLITGNAMIGADMNSLLIATIAGLATAFFWGTSDYLSARGIRSFNPYQISFGMQLSSAIIVLLIFLSAGIHIHDAGQVIRILISSVFINLAYIVFLRALDGGAIGIIAPLGNIYPVFTVVLSVLLLHTHFSLQRIVAILIIITGAGLLAYEKNHHKVALRELYRKTILALIAALIWGIGFFIVSPLTATVPWQTITVITEISSIVLFGGLLIGTSRRRTFRDIRLVLRSKTVLAIGLIGEFGLISLYFGSSHAKSIVIPVVLSTCGPLVTSLWGALFEHEKLGVFKRVGALVTVGGIIILNLG